METQSPVRAGRSCDRHLTVNSPPPPVLPVSRTFSALPVHSHACSPLSSRLPSPPPINPHLSTRGWTLEGLGLLLPTAARHRVQIQGPPKRAGHLPSCSVLPPTQGTPAGPGPSTTPQMVEPRPTHAPCPRAHLPLQPGPAPRTGHSSWTRGPLAAGAKESQAGTQPRGPLCWSGPLGVGNVDDIDRCFNQ